MQPCSTRDFSNVSITTADGSKQMSMLFESTANDIFRKFDMLLNRELGYSEFKGFCDCVGKHMTEEEFHKDILNKFVNLQ